MRSDNLLATMNKMNHLDNILKMKSFQYLDCKVYTNERLNTSKEVNRNSELSIITQE